MERLFGAEKGGTSSLHAEVLAVGKMCAMLSFAVPIGEGTGAFACGLVELIEFHVGIRETCDA